MLKERTGAILSPVRTRVTQTLADEGLIALITKGFSFLIEKLVWYENYYVLTGVIHDMSPDPGANKPAIENLSYRFFHSNREADEIAATHEDFRSYYVNSIKRLDSTAVALCVYVDKEVGFACWLALSEKAKKTFNYIPYRVDFDNNNSCSGGYLTTARHRRKGLMTYAVHLENMYLKEKGIVLDRSIIKARNHVAVQSSYGFGYRFTAKARYFKFLWWKRWQETPVNIVLD